MDQVNGTAGTMAIIFMRMGVGLVEPAPPAPPRGWWMRRDIVSKLPETLNSFFSNALGFNGDIPGRIGLAKGLSGGGWERRYYAKTIKLRFDVLIEDWNLEYDFMERFIEFTLTNWRPNFLKSGWNGGEEETAQRPMSYIIPYRAPEIAPAVPMSSPVKVGTQLIKKSLMKIMKFSG